MRLLKWISLSLGALLALVLIGVLVVVWLVDPNSFKSNIESRVTAATGREFKLAGDIEFGFFPWLALRTGEGHFGNPAGFGPDPMASWKSARIGAKLFPLLRGELFADRVVLSGVDLRLTRRADGVANWEGMGGSEPSDPNAKPLEPHIDGIEIVDSRLLFVDETVPRRVEITALNLTTDEVAYGEPLTDTTIAGVLHMDGFASGGVPFRVEVPRLVAPKDFSAVEVKEFEVAFGALEIEGAVAGTLGESPSLEGKLETNEFDPRILLASVGVTTPKTTDPRALGKVAVAASWSMEKGAIGIDPFTLTLDDTHLRGSFHRAGGENPIGEFALRGDTLDVARYIPPADPASEPFVLPTAMLKALKFRGTVQLERATLDDIEMKEVTLRLLLDENGLRSVPKPAAGTP